MIGILIDHNIEGQATLLWNVLQTEGWLRLVPLHFMQFTDIGIPFDSSDRFVWRVAQARKLLLLTANRNMQDENSLEQTIREENQEGSLPVITISNAERIAETAYRAECSARLVEIAIYLDDYMGAGRLYIP